MGRAFDAVEKDMTLLGATGVEDQLQVGVEETLEALKAAGIKVRDLGSAEELLIAEHFPEWERVFSFRFVSFFCRRFGC